MSENKELGIDIFDADNELWIDTDSHSISISVSPEQKILTHKMRMKDDVYYRTETIKYKIDTHPIKVYSRLVERYDEPPKEYLVRDGVVLESDILKKSKFIGEGLVEDLRKEVEWQELTLSAASPLVAFLLSRHPEIVSKDEFKRYLRQNCERVKSGLDRVRNYLAESNDKGLEIITNARYKTNSIWFSDEKVPKDENDQQKLFDYIEKQIQPKLFEQDSKDYVGISYNEFYVGNSLIEKLEYFLDDKSYITNDEKEANQSGGFSYKWPILIFLSIVALSWGIWTAIGVFVLGAIMIGVMKN